MNTKRKIITTIIGIEAVIIVAVIIFLFYINSVTVKINHQLELAQRYLLEEDYEQAVAAYEIVIEIDPKNVDAYLGLTEAYVAADDLENAVRVLEQAAVQTDSEEILEMLQIYTAEIEQRQLEAQKAEEATAAVAQNQTENNMARTERTDFPDGSYYIYYYDSNDDSSGNFIKREKYSSDGTLIEYLLNSYDSNGNCIKVDEYRGDGTFIEYYIRSHDSSGNCIKVERYSLEDALIEYWVYSYGSNRNLIKGERYNGDSTLIEYWFYSYDSNGNLIKGDVMQNTSGNTTDQISQ